MRFVLYQTLTVTVLMTAVRDVYTQFSQGRHAFDLWGYLVAYTIVGFVSACWGWTSQEEEYRKAQISQTSPNTD